MNSFLLLTSLILASSVQARPAGNTPAPLPSSMTLDPVPGALPEDLPKVLPERRQVDLCTMFPIACPGTK
ncbi:hypothetical protein GGP41_001176 [Bipolaris sorokiniana]|uniref:Uncharacterized protein n=2 Tax=Cochliobolus sativus TaxID=45130 RepID=A0A8H5Z907_COCSA|nr:uncharacterized protein COCSADRAFT_177396 [Bipolaris sorokiniana ND90Pr]EMD69693.1 hypothetical protein COCSADRAFT_177396 [Bipolaris sorokiniana ND90Pr]KAF5845035.1 hypothetical protein GGP41_001176 [Bipolaris sorokiniana]